MSRSPISEALFSDSGTFYEGLKVLPVEDVTICESTQQMLTKAREDGVELSFDRAAEMKACPIGADSACCKHCAMGPCRLISKKPFDKVGVCGATIDTIQGRNFGRMVAAGASAHTDHGMSMLDLFRDVVNGKNTDYQIKDEQKLLDTAASIGIETADRELKDIANDLYAEHLEFNEHEPMACANTIVERAIDRFKNRKAAVDIPSKFTYGIHGFSHEYVNYMLGGQFRASYVPLNDNIINGRIRGVAGVVGCTNPRTKHDWIHVELVKELIKNDVLVLQTGCSQIALAKTGLYQPEAAAKYAGPGLAEVCETVGIPPVLGCGSCVDNSRLLIAASEMVKVGGLGDRLVDLPVVGAAPEWMSEKAISIGHYFVASGVYTVFGITFPYTPETKWADLLFKGLADQGLGTWDFAPGPEEMAAKMIAKIDEKRKALGIDKARERKLMTMEDRRQIEV